MGGPSRKRCLLRAAFVGALGLVTTLLVSWSLALRDVPGPAITGSYHRYAESKLSVAFYMDPLGRADTLDIDVYRSPGAAMYNTTIYGPDFVPLLGITMPEHQKYAPTPDPRDMVASWSKRRVLPWLEPGGQWPKSNGADWRCVDARGWPLVCFYSEYLLTPNFGHDTRGSFTMPGTRVRHYGDLFGRNKSVELPYFPIWPNLALNAAIYSAAWWLLLIAPSTIRSTFRRRLGRCAACNYDLSATPIPLPCPECGHTRNLPASNR